MFPFVFVWVHSWFNRPLIAILALKPNTRALGFYSPELSRKMFVTPLTHGLCYH